MSGKPSEKSTDGGAPNPFMRVFPSIMLPMFIAVVDQTIVATALPDIAISLGDVAHMSGIIAFYLIANTIAAPVYGRLGDMFGRRRMMGAALIVMMLGSILCALAPTSLALVFARIIQGLGGGGLMTLSQSLISESVPPRDRARYQGYLSTVIVVSNSFGPIVGGWMTSAFGWRSIFWINLPLGALALILTRKLPSLKPSMDKARFDNAGLFYFVLFVVPLLLALQQARAAMAGDGVETVLLLTLAGCALALLLRRENRVSQPLLPLSLLRNPTIWRSDLMAACHGAALVSLISFIPTYLRATRGLSPEQTGYFLLPVAIGIGVGAMVTGRLVSRTGQTLIFPSAALPPVVFLLGIVAFYADDFSPRTLAILLGLIAICMGSVMAVVQVTVQNAAGSTMLGAAAGSVQFSRAVGASFGTALTGVALTAVFQANDAHDIGAFILLLEQGPSAFAQLPPEAANLARAATHASFRAAFLTIDLFVALATFCAWTIPVRKL